MRCSTVPTRNSNLAPIKSFCKQFNNSKLNNYLAAVVFSSNNRYYLIEVVESRIIGPLSADLTQISFRRRKLAIYMLKTQAE